MPASTTTAHSPAACRPVALQTIVGLTRQSTRASVAILSFRHGSTGAIITQGDAGYTSDEPGVSALADTLARVCETEPNGLLISNLDTDARFATAKFGPGAKSVAAIPIWSAGKLVGVLAVLSDSADAFSDLDAATLQITGIWIGASFDSLLEEWATSNGQTSTAFTTDGAVIRRSVSASVLHPERHLAAALAKAGISPEAPLAAPDAVVVSAAPVTAGRDRSGPPVKESPAVSSPVHRSQDRPASAPQPAPPLVTPGHSSVPARVPAVVPIRAVHKGSEGPLSTEQKCAAGAGSVTELARSAVAMPGVSRQMSACSVAGQSAASPSEGLRATTVPAFGPGSILERRERPVHEKQHGLKILAAAVLVMLAVAASGWFLYSRGVAEAGVPTRASESSFAQAPRGVGPEADAPPSAITRQSASQRLMPANTEIAAGQVLRANTITANRADLSAEVPVREVLQPAPTTGKRTDPNDADPPELILAEESRVPSLAPAAPSAPVAAPAMVVQGLPAVLISQVAPVYPPQARSMRAEGTVVLFVQITAQGKVGGVHVVSGPSVFRESAIAAVKKWRYKPAQLDDKSLESSAEVTLRFSVPQ